MTRANQPTFIDLFAGIGGMRLAFQQARARCVFTCEWDKYAQKTYLENFPDSHIHSDIRDLDPASVPDHDILVAGFPCQPFSIAGVSKKKSLGREHGFRDATQGTLFFDLQEIIAAKQPRAFLLENVKHLVRHDGGRTFGVICQVLQEELGYRIHSKVLDAQAFVPQHRERVIIVGFRDGLNFSWPKLPSKAVRLGDILLPEQDVEARYTLSKHLWTYLQNYARKHRERGNGFGFGLVGPDDVARTLSARYYKDGSEILIDRGGRRNPRRLTPRECARLMGFPDSFKIPVSDTRAYKQFGNSVVVPLIGAVAKRIVKSLADGAREGATQFTPASVNDQFQIPLRTSS
jgi:DNA (cytosine-5)-methyltransferase 1